MTEPNGMSCGEFDDVAAELALGVLTGRERAEAIAHLDAALTRHQDMGSRPWTALTQEAYGHVLRVRGLAGDIERAGTLRQSAMRTAGELGLDAITNRPRLRG